jgi:hypothetical protein
VQIFRGEGCSSTKKTRKGQFPCYSILNENFIKSYILATHYYCGDDVYVIRRWTQRHILLILVLVYIYTVSKLDIWNYIKHVELRSREKQIIPLVSFWNLHTLQVTTSDRPGKGKIDPQLGQNNGSEEKIASSCPDFEAMFVLIYQTGSTWTNTF